MLFFLCRFAPSGQLLRDTLHTHEQTRQAALRQQTRFIAQPQQRPQHLELRGEAIHRIDTRLRILRPIGRMKVVQRLQRRGDYPITDRIAVLLRQVVQLVQQVCGQTEQVAVYRQFTDHDIRKFEGNVRRL